MRFLTPDPEDPLDPEDPEDPLDPLLNPKPSIPRETSSQNRFWGLRFGPHFGRDLANV